MSTSGDGDLLRDLASELASDPHLRETQIHARVEDGLVTLSGWVDTCIKRWAADRAAYRVAGIRSVVNEVEVRFPASVERNDEEIAVAATLAIQSAAPHLAATVEHGLVTLSGCVEWNFQRTDAERVVRGLSGVNAVNNEISVRAFAILAELKHEIRKTLETIDPGAPHEGPVPRRGRHYV